jgi:hypothetical protein
VGFQAREKSHLKRSSALALVAKAGYSKLKNAI